MSRSNTMVGRVPPLSLPTLDDAGEVRLRAPARGPLVLHLPRRDWRTDEYTRGLLAQAPTLERWGARLVLVVPVEEESGRDVAVAGRNGAPGPATPAPVAIASDPDATLRRRLGLRGGTAALLVADRWGAVYVAEENEDPSRLPDASAIDAWLRFIATQCPECGVPDEPGRGEWA